MRRIRHLGIGEAHEDTIFDGELNTKEIRNFLKEKKKKGVIQNNFEFS